MRRLRYSVASSIDGFIAGPNGEYDWIPMDPDIDFDAMFGRYDTLLMGRKTFEASAAYPTESMAMWKGMRVIVCSNTLAAAAGAELWSGDVATRVTQLKQEVGKDIWLFGGGELFRTLLEAGVDDDIEIAMVPVLLGGGIPLRAMPAALTHLTVTEHRLYPKSGTVMMTYAVQAARSA